MDGLTFFVLFFVIVHLVVIGSMAAFVGFLWLISRGGYSQDTNPDKEDGA